jgi:hypothetical protein
MRLLLAAILALGAARPALAGDTAGAVTRWSGGQWTVWRIDRPATGPRLTEYPEIRLRAGDVVTFDMGGCVPRRSGGRRPVVWLPGAPGPAPLAAVLRQPITVPESAGPDSRPLRLAGGACASPTEPYVFVAVKSVRAADAAPAPMDLVGSGSTDENGVALNPQWGLQVTEPGSVPDVPQICFTVPGWFDNPLCSTQHPGVDIAAGLRLLICAIGTTTPIPGHVNYFPSTYEGPLFWDSFDFFDGDYNVQLVPPTQNGLTSHNPVSLKGEFDSRETIDHFGTPWWVVFRLVPDAIKKILIDGKPAIMSGFTGVDCEHGCPSELHPVWVLAIHVHDDPADDVWAVFVRNWGNEGFCSDAQHEVNWAGNRFTLTLPWRAGATSARLGPGTVFLANDAGISGSWRSVPGEKVNLTFTLPAPSSRAIVHGELHLGWSGGALRPTAGDSSSTRPVEVEREGQGGHAEALVRDLIMRLTPEQRRSLESRFTGGPRSFDSVPVPLKRARSGIEEATAASAPPSVTSRPDPARTAEEERRLRALLDAFGGRVPGPIGEALEGRPEKP